MKKEMLINVLQPEECRIAIMEDGILEELYVERTSHESYVGNIYKGRIVNIEPSIQAAFVDFGVGRNGFLHVSDVEPAYYRHLERRGSPGGGRPRGRDRFRGSDRPTNARQRRPAGPAPAEPEAWDETAPPEEDVAPEETGREGAPVGPASETPPAPVAPERDRPAGPGEGAETRQSDKYEPHAHERPRAMDSAERRTEVDEVPIPGEAPYDDLFSASDAPDSRSEAMDLPEPAHGWEERDPEDGDRAEPEERRDSGGDPEPGDDFHADRPRARGGRRDGRRGGRGGPGRRGPGRPPMGRPKPLIQDIFKRGQEVLVQVIKEGIGTKGPTLSTYISIAGRYLVLMPGLNRIGVSRKIADDEQRRRLREILNELSPPRGLGFIIRTAGMDKTKKELQRDLAYLSRLWIAVVRRIRGQRAPAVIYKESDMIRRTIRDTFTGEIDTIWVDEPAAFEDAQEFLQTIMPRYAGRIRLYADNAPLFHKYGIEEEIARIQQRHVPLPNGGSVVIDQTEALVAIDVNSGNFRADNNAEETAYQMNLLAAKEIARQLRLRDLGGVIVNDFIDMREEKHRRGVERALRDAIKRDRARTKILRISAFGLVEMTRQRIRPSLKRSVFQDCPHCRGTGQVKTCESMSIEVMRMLQLAAHHRNVQRVQIRVAEDVASYLLNRKRREITRLEETGQIQVTITGSPTAAPEALDFACYDNNDNEVQCLPQDDGKARRR
jgi:ribonuclease E